MKLHPTRQQSRRHGNILTLLLVCSLARFGSSLVSGTILVKAPRGFDGFSDGDTTCKSEEGATIADTRRRISARPKVIDYQSFEEKERRERRELEWIVRNTSKILGPDSQPLIGSMTERSIQLTYDLMRAWARRASKKESNAPHVVERLLQRLLKERDARNELVGINTVLYNIVLDAWSYSSEEGSAERTEEILMLMERKYKEGDEHIKPDKESYKE